MTNEQKQASITKKIINGEYVAGKEYFCEFCYSCRDTFCGWDKEQCIKAGGLPRACHICCLCATAYNRSNRKKGDIMKYDNFFVNEEPFFDREMINLHIPPVASFIDDELEKGIIKASLNMGYEIDESKLKKWIDRCIKLDNLDENTVNDIAIEKKFRQLKNEIDYLKNRPDTKWQKLKEWVEKERKNTAQLDDVFEKGINTAYCSIKEVMQKLEAEDE